MSVKERLSPGGAPPDPPAAAAGDGAASIGPTAIMPAVGHACPSCRKANHPGAPQCVFCGVAFAPAPAGPPVADAAPPSTAVTLGSPAAPAAPPAATAPTEKAAHEGPPVVPGTAWSEGPLDVSGDGSVPGIAALRAPEVRFRSDPPPAASRHSFFSPDSDELAAPPVADPLIGVVVAERYRILEPLGRGGMGIVYKVEHVRIGKLLAMKLLTGELSRNPEVVRRFKQEALTASRLNSANTVQVFDFGVSEHLTYLVMELVAGDDLARALRAQGPFPFPRIGKIVIQVCSSLAEAHQKGIVHRDVKPENVMILRARDATDVAKVLDFGLAKLREGAELNDVTSQGAIVGTPYYMAPEQIRGEAVDHRTDIYALGALMYRALTGHYPFNGPTPMSVFTKHLTEPPIQPSARAPELAIPPGADAIVLKALAKDPEHRYQRIEELQAALVDEVRAAGTLSVEDLLDSGELRRLQRVSAAVGSHGPAQKAEIATRDEVERYERKLRRQRWGALASLGVVLVGAAAGAAIGGLRLYAADRAQSARGREIEPNDTPAQATPLPFGTSITGHLGKRIDPTHGDRDFYVVDVPAPAPSTPAVISFKVTPLPNFAMCTLLYRRGFDTPVGQYCVGRPGRELSIPALRLDPGRYFFAVMQDLDPYGGAVPFIHENVSDPYVVTVGAAEPRPDEEVEPNDRVASANVVPPGGAVTGRLSWTRDEDVFCVAGGAPGAIRWKVKDEIRDAGAVLEVTPLRGAIEGAPVRVHAALGKPTATDAESPWISDRVPAEGDDPRCLRVRLSNDPWSGAAAALVPSGGGEPYVIEVVKD